MNTIELFGNFSHELVTVLQHSVTVTKQELDDPAPLPVGDIPSSLAEFYNTLSHLNIEWETKEITNTTGQKLKGRINIIKAEQVLRDWKGVTYFDDKNASEAEKNFKVVDFFVDEACAGYIQNATDSNQMYYLYFEDEPQPMGVP